MARPHNEEELIKLAKASSMTPEQQEEQRRSFVFGNTALENPFITREMVEAVADADAASEGHGSNEQ